jgi:hypothetical protein
MTVHSFSVQQLKEKRQTNQVEDYLFFVVVQ